MENLEKGGGKSKCKIISRGRKVSVFIEYADEYR